MRPQQQNRRMRGRNNNNNNNNNRKGPNPLTRSYESNGPDVKIRGSAQQIADKYLTLARDAQSSGDRVMAENYLQHAEHYNRIIAAAQAQLPQQQQTRDMRDDYDDDDEGRDDGDQAMPQNQQQQRQPDDGSGPQPYINGIPAEVALTGEAQPGEGEQPRENRAGSPNGNGHVGQEGEEGAQRRSRRSRRGRGRSGHERGPEGEQSASGEDESQPAGGPETEVADPVG